MDVYPMPVVGPYNCSFPFSEYISIETYVLAVIVLFGLFLFCFYRSGLYRREKLLSITGISLIVVGGAYNLVNRYFSGCVHDPLSFFGLFAFNYADILINLGLTTLLLVYLKDFIWSRKQNG
jgi:lipoprotein signal peptidase